MTRWRIAAALLAAAWTWAPAPALAARASMYAPVGDAAPLLAAGFGGIARPGDPGLVQALSHADLAGAGASALAPLTAQWNEADWRDIRRLSEARAQGRADEEQIAELRAHLVVSAEEAAWDVQGEMGRLSGQVREMMQQPPNSGAASLERVRGLSARVDEMAGYGLFLDREQRREYRALAAEWGRWREAFESDRSSRLRALEESEGRKLAGGDSKGAEAVAAAIQPPPVGAAPYRAAAALLQSMRVSKANRSLNDLETLYRGFGFEWTDGTGHVKVNYRGYLRRPLTVPRHGEMKPYVVQAIKAIDELHVRLGLPLPDEDEAEPSIVVPLSRRTPPQRIPAGAINASLGD